MVERLSLFDDSIAPFASYVLNLFFVSFALFTLLLKAIRIVLNQCQVVVICALVKLISVVFVIELKVLQKVFVFNERPLEVGLQEDDLNLFKKVVTEVIL